MGVPIFSIGLFVVGGTVAVVATNVLSEPVVVVVVVATDESGKLPLLEAIRAKTETIKKLFMKTTKWKKKYKYNQCFA